MLTYCAFPWWPLCCMSYCTFPWQLLCRMSQRNCSRSTTALAYRLFRFFKVCSLQHELLLISYLDCCNASQSTASTLVDQLFILKSFGKKFTLWLGILPFRSHLLDSLTELPPVVMDFAESMAEDNSRVNPMCDHRCKNVIGLQINHNFLFYFGSIRKR